MYVTSKEDASHSLCVETFHMITVTPPTFPPIRFAPVRVRFTDTRGVQMNHIFILFLIFLFFFLSSDNAVTRDTRTLISFGAR